MKKNFLRLFASVLTLIFILTSSVSVFAEEDNYLNDYKLSEVTTVYKTGEKLAVDVVENGAVLLFEVRVGTFTDGCSNFLHPLSAF